MTERLLAETEDRGPVVVGTAYPDPPLGVAQARRIVHRRLDQLVGGVLLSGLGITRLARRLKVHSFAAGETIVNKGVRGDFLGLVTQGQVAVHAPAHEDSSPAFDSDSPAVLLLPGGTFGEAMLLDGRPSGSTLRALTAAEIYILRRDDFLTVAGQRLSQPARGIGRLLRGLAVAALGLALVLLVVGVYFGLSLLLSRIQAGDLSSEAGASIPVSDAIEIVEPQQGAIWQNPTSVRVRAVLEKRGYSQAALMVNGLQSGVQINADPGTVPWVVEWTWDNGFEGSHALVVQAQTEKGELAASLPVTVTIVPEGTLAFASNRDGPHDVYAMGTDGRDLSRLTAGHGDLRRPVWGSDTVLAFVTESEVGKAIIRQMSLTREGTTDLFFGWDPAWSPEGSRLAYAATVDDVSQVFTSTIPGGAPSQVTEEAAYAGQPAWSPDGTRLAYVAQQEGNWDIWVAPLDGSEPHRLTDDPAMDWAPAWAPDGSSLAFVSNRGGGHQIFVMQSNGAGVQSLTEFPHGAESPAWSPDGHWLAFVAYSGEGAGINAREIHLMRADGRDPVRLTHNAFDDTQPDWRRVP